MDSTRKKIAIALTEVNAIRIRGGFPPLIYLYLRK